MRNYSTPILFGLSLVASAETIPKLLWGKWTVKRELPTHSISCWGNKEGRAMIGTEVEYAERSFRWQKTVTMNPVAESRMIDAEEFHRERSGMGANSAQITFAELGIREAQVLQIEIHHPDANITGGTVEIPGDRVFVKDQNVLVFSACGVYFEAVRRR